MWQDKLTKEELSKRMKALVKKRDAKRPKCPTCGNFLDNQRNTPKPKYKKKLKELGILFPKNEKKNK